MYDIEDFTTCDDLIKLIEIHVVSQNNYQRLSNQ